MKSLSRLKVTGFYSSIFFPLKAFVHLASGCKSDLLAEKPKVLETRLPTSSDIQEHFCPEHSDRADQKGFR